MRQTFSQRRNLRRAVHQWRRRPRQSNAVPRAAHPRIAGSLEAVARRCANAADRLVAWMEGSGWALFLLAALALLWARVQGVML